MFVLKVIDITSMTFFIFAEKIIYMKKISVFLLALLLVNCSGNNEDLSPSGIDKLYVFQKNTDVKTPENYTNLYEVDVNTGELVRKIGGYEKLHGRIYYDLSYLKNEQEFLIRQSVYQGTRGEELVKMGQSTKKRTTISLNNSVEDLTSLDDRLFGFILNSDSADLVEVDIKGNVLSVIKRFNDLPNAPSGNKKGLEGLTFSRDKKLLIVHKRETFYLGDPSKMFVYNIVTKEKKTITIGGYDSVICGNNGRMFGLKTIYDTIKKVYYSKLIEFDINTGKELKDVYTFDASIGNSDSKELIFLLQSNQVVLKRFGLGCGMINVDSGEMKSITINYDYRDITGLNAMRIISF